MTETPIAESQQHGADLSFRELTEMLPQLIWTAQANGTTDYCNSRLLKYFDKNMEDFQVLNWQEVVHPDDLKRTQDEWLKACTIGAEYFIEHRILRGDGLYRWIETRAVPIHNGNGVIKHWVGTFTDIDERKRTEDHLRESASNLRTLHESMRDAFVSVAMNGRLIDYNSAYLELLGYSEEEIRNKTYIDLTPEKWHALEARIVTEQVLARGFSDVYEKEYRHKDGRIIPIELRTVLIRDASGEPKLMWAIVRDISERKRIEAELTDAKYKAENANRAKSEFLANISHEIRTPLTSVIGFAELLEGTGLSEEQQRFLRHITSSSENLLSMINDILDLSRIESGKLELRAKKFCLRDVIDDVVTTQKPVAKAKRLAIKVNMPDETPNNLMGDPVRLKQILFNLLSNAIKFTDRGDIIIAIVVEERGRSMTILRFDVIDSGIGIEPKYLSEIFKPFSQLDTSNTRKYGGTGLGLAICDQITSLMGGNIWVDSNLDAGSTFHVRIPFEVNDDSSPSNTSHQVDKSHLWHGEPLHILLVEDNKTNRMIFTEMLEKYGHSVDIAENGVVSLEKWRQSKYDIILMDVQMSVMDGLEAVSKIREMEEGRDTRVPIIALTAHAMKNDHAFLLNRGFDGYLSKPTRSKDLFGEIKRCLLKK